MSAAKQKTTKTTKSTSTKRSGGKSARRASEMDTPVFFRLPDLTAVMAEEAPQMVHSVEVTAAVEPTAAPAPPAEKTPKPNRNYLLQLRKFSLIRGLRYYRIASRTVVWAVNLPMVGPTAALSSALLVTAAIIYTPWQNGNTTAQKPEAPPSPSQVAQPAAKPTIPTVIVDARPKAAEPKPSALEFDEPVEEDVPPLKKVASELDKQLFASESTRSRNDEAAAQPVGSELSVAAEEDSEEDENFTAPWRRRRNESRSASATVAAEKPRKPTPPLDEELFEDAEEFGGSRYSSPRTVYRDRRQEKPRYDELLKEPQSRAAYHEDLEDEEFEAPARPRRRTTAKEPLTEEFDEPATRSPWHRIRQERLEREEKRDEGSAAPPAARPQYRSPPGQDITFDEDWSTESAAKPREVSPRKGVR